MIRTTPRIGRRTLLAGAAGLATGQAVHAGAGSGPGSVPATEPLNGLELAVAAAAPTTPTGLALSRSGRMFLFMPRFDERTVFTAGEVFPDRRVVPYPNEALNRPDPARAADTLFHVPNGVIDREERLWLLDAGLMASSGEPVRDAAKLVCVDLASDRIVRTIPLRSAILPTSSLNDLRVDAGPGRANAAYVTDQGQDGQGAIVVVDLASGQARRCLSGHASTASVPGIVKIVEGRHLLKRVKDAGTGAVTTSPVRGGANGIALSPDGAHLYFAPLMSRRLYRIETGRLLGGLQSPDDGVEDLGEKGLTGGLAADARGRLYLSLQEFNAIGRRDADGGIEVLASDPRLIWPDTFHITPDGWLYVSAAQANRRPEHNEGIDRQRPPYAILRMKIDAGPA